MSNLQNTKNLREEFKKIISMWEEESCKSINVMDIIHVLESLDERLEIVEEHVYGIWSREKEPKKEQS